MASRKYHRTHLVQCLFSGKTVSWHSQLQCTRVVSADRHNSASTAHLLHTDCTNVPAEPDVSHHVLLTRHQCGSCAHSQLCMHMYTKSCKLHHHAKSGHCTRCVARSLPGQRHLTGVGIIACLPIPTVICKAAHQARNTRQKHTSA